MAELSGAEQARLELQQQLAAIVWVRFQLVRNSMRTARGALEAISQVWVGIWFALLGLGGAVGFGFGGWHFVHNGEAIWLSALLWPLFLFWQIFPIAASTFSEHIDTSHLARYPLTFRAYSLVRVLFGSVDVANLVGSLCLLGLTVGTGIARPRLLTVMVPAALLFIAFNLLLAQMIFVWLERWLAKRRTREIMTVIFFLVILGFNFIGPVTERWSHISRGAEAAHLRLLVPLAAWLPPGLPGEALAAAAQGNWLAGLGALVVLAVCAAVVLKLLNIRLRAEYAGEVLSEGLPATPVKRLRSAAAPAAARWARLPGLDGPAAAVAHKELNYVRRSPVMFFSLAMPVVILVLFALGGFGGHGPGLARAAGYAYPVGLAYALLAFTNLVFNVCGAEAGGIQFYFMAPVRFRQVLAGKNLAYAVLLAIEAAVLYVIACLLDRPPSAVILAATLVGFVFATLCTLSAGNIVSLYFPKKLDLSRMGRHAARGTSSMIAMAIQAVAVGLVVLAMLGGFVLHAPWVGLAVVVVLGVLAAIVYAMVLAQSDGLALARREALISELSKS
ncbi:MAG: hypothetical protein ACRD1C_12080 [Terriglobales bacterium]